MSNIERYRGGGMVPSRTSRAIARINSSTDIDSAIIQAKAELKIVKVDSVTAIAGQGLRDIAMLSQLKQSLAQTVPLASGRLQAIGDMAALAVSDVVANAARRIGR